MPADEINGIGGDGSGTGARIIFTQPIPDDVRHRGLGAGRQQDDRAKQHDPRGEPGLGQKTFKCVPAA